MKTFLGKEEVTLLQEPQSTTRASLRRQIICTLGARHSSPSQVYLVSNQVYGVQGV